MNVYDEIMRKYSVSPYRVSNNCFSINDDRVGSVVSFTLYVYDDKLTVYFSERKRNRTQTVESFKDFERKWYLFYNDLS